MGITSMWRSSSTVTVWVMTRFTAVTQLSHHGMLYVPQGYTFGKGMFEMEEVKGGSSYGAGTFAGDGSRQPSELELQQAFYQASSEFDSSRKGAQKNSMVAL